MMEIYKKKKKKKGRKILGNPLIWSYELSLLVEHPKFPFVLLCSPWFEYKMDREVLGDRQQHEVCMGEQ